MDNNTIKEFIKGKRLAAIDYGRKRVGFAVCDEFHVTVNPRHTFFLEDKNFWEDLSNELIKENVSAIVVGVPYREEPEKNELIKEIICFIDELKQKITIPVYEFDENFSSKEAMLTMINIGKKKKQRATKTNIDKIAAAIILRNFLKEIEG